MLLNTSWVEEDEMMSLILKTKRVKTTKMLMKLTWKSLRLRNRERHSLNLYMFILKL